MVCIAHDMPAAYQGRVEAGVEGDLAGDLEDEIGRDRSSATDGLPPLEEAREDMREERDLEVGSKGGRGRREEREAPESLAQNVASDLDPRISY